MSHKKDPWHSHVEGGAENPLSSSQWISSIIWNISPDDMHKK